MRSSSEGADNGRATAAFQMLDRAVLKQSSEHMERLVELMSTAGGEMTDAAQQFCLQHSTAAADFQTPTKDRGGISDSKRLRHLMQTIEQMNGFALRSAQLALSRALTFCEEMKDRRSASSAAAAEAASDKSVSPPSTGLFPPLRVNSVEDLSVGSEEWLSVMASIVDDAVNVLALSIVACPGVRLEVQTELLQAGAIAYLARALAVDRETELACFAENFRTVHMNLLANLTFESPAAAKLVAADENLMARILAGTSIDTENPGCAEWAEFVLRNILQLAPEARDFIKKLRVQHPPAVNSTLDNQVFSGGCIPDDLLLPNGSSVTFRQVDM